MNQLKYTLCVLAVILAIDLSRPYISGSKRFRLFGKKGFLPKLLAHGTAFVTLLSFYYALVALDDTHKSGDEQSQTMAKQSQTMTKQQQALDSTRRALETMVRLAEDQRKLSAQSGSALNELTKSATKQQDVLSKQLGISGKHFDFLMRQNNRRPVLTFNFGNIDEEKIKQNDTLALQRKPDGSLSLQVLVSNIGDTIAYRPVLIAIVEPKTVHIREAHLLADEIRPHYLSSKSFADDGIIRKSLSGGGVVYDLRFESPVNTRFFTVTFTLSASNATHTRSNLICKAVPYATN